MENISQQTLASIVKANHRTVPVLEKYKLDFCCKGKRTLSEACRENNLITESVIQELLQTQDGEKNAHTPFEEMTAEQLINFIVTHHHFYVKQSVPQIFHHVQKVAAKHGDRFPYMIHAAQLFAEVADDLISHMQKEEMILFPRIKQLEETFANGEGAKGNESFILAPINVMEEEHEHAGNLLAEIRTLTNDYTAPADACTTFRITLAELKEFEEDLHKHVHLENNILFPLAEKMLQSVAMTNSEVSN
jgi:regulator of cell morphogenesis and NO signaling